MARSCPTRYADSATVTSAERLLFHALVLAAYRELQGGAQEDIDVDSSRRDYLGMGLSLRVVLEILGCYLLVLFLASLQLVWFRNWRRFSQRHGGIGAILLAIDATLSERPGSCVVVALILPIWMCRHLWWDAAAREPWLAVNAGIFLLALLVPLSNLFAACVSRAKARAYAKEAQDAAAKLMKLLGAHETLG